MSRIRSVHPGFFTDEDLVSVSMAARLLFIGIGVEADDKGVFEWKPLTIKMRVFPADNVDVSVLLGELESVGAIRRYDAAGKSYGAIRNFRRFQKPKTPNDIHPASAEILSFVGLVSEPKQDGGHGFPQKGETFPQNGEKSFQMEDGGEEEEEEEVSPPTPQGGESETESFSEKVVKAWNAGPATKGATKALKLDSSRRKQLATRVKEHGEPAVLDAIRGIAASPHHCGKNDRGWKASLSWILESPGNFMKAVELAPPIEQVTPAAEKTPEERQAQCRDMIAFNRRLGRDSEVEEWTRRLIAAGGKVEPFASNLTFIGAREKAQLQSMIGQVGVKTA